MLLWIYFFMTTPIKPKAFDCYPKKSALGIKGILNL